MVQKKRYEMKWRRKVKVHTGTAKEVMSMLFAFYARPTCKAQTFGDQRASPGIFITGQSLDVQITGATALMTKGNEAKHNQLIFSATRSSIRVEWDGSFPHRMWRYLSDASLPHTCGTDEELHSSPSGQTVLFYKRHVRNVGGRKRKNFSNDEGKRMGNSPLEQVLRT